MPWLIKGFGTDTQKPPLNAHSDVSSRARGLNFGLSLHLHPYFVYASSEDSGETGGCTGLIQPWPLTM